MYTPAAFAEADLNRLQNFVEQHSFATVVTNTNGPMAISHLPLLLNRSDSPTGTLYGHFARANDHWQVVGSGTTTAIFQGPHAYISPAWYQEPDVVPTWNYVAVHASGQLRIREDRDFLLRLLSRSVDFYESGRTQPWRLTDQNADFIERLLGGIVGFELPIERLEGKWKLSQNHSAQRRSRVIAELRQSGSADALAVASAMEETPASR